MNEQQDLLDYQSLKKKIICVTGGNGFIGKKLIEKLSKIGCCVRAITRKKNAIFPSNVDVFIGDLTDTNLSLKNFIKYHNLLYHCDILYHNDIKDCDILYHCAGEINYEQQMSLLHINFIVKLICTEVIYFKYFI